MSLLTIGELDVRLSPGTAYDVEAWGDAGRSVAGEMRADVRAHHRAFRITTPILSKTDMEALRDALLATPPLDVSGDVIGDPSTFHPRRIRLQPITAEDWIVSFELHESVESILFVYRDWALKEVDGVLVFTDDLENATHFLGYDSDASELSINDTSEGIDTRVKVVRRVARVFG